MPEETTPLLSSSQTLVHEQVIQVSNGANDTKSRWNWWPEKNARLYTTGSPMGKNALSSLWYHPVVFYPVSSRSTQSLVYSLTNEIVFVSGSFFPSIPSISKDMNTSPSVVRSAQRLDADAKLTLCFYSLTVSVSTFAACIGALLGASYSGFCTCIIYLVSLGHDNQFSTSFFLAYPPHSLVHLTQSYSMWTWFAIVRFHFINPFRWPETYIPRRSTSSYNRINWCRLLSDNARADDLEIFTDAWWKPRSFCWWRCHWGFVSFRRWQRSSDGRVLWRKHSEKYIYEHASGH